MYFKLMPSQRMEDSDNFGAHVHAPERRCSTSAWRQRQLAIMHEHLTTMWSRS